MLLVGEYKKTLKATAFQLSRLDFKFQDYLKQASKNKLSQEKLDLHFFV